MFLKNHNNYYLEKRKGCGQEWLGAHVVVQTKDHSAVNQGISRGLDETLENFLLCSEDRHPTRFPERLDVGCMEK